MIRGIIVFTLLGVVLASRSANQYIENVLQTTLPTELRNMGLNPASLPPFNVPFGYQGIYQSMAQADFVNGNATGFALTKRKSECQGPKMVYGELTINCTLSLSISTSYSVRVVNNSRIYNARSFGNVAETLVYVVISGRPQNYVGSVKQFQVQRLGLITPTVSGLPQGFNKYVKVMQDVYKANVSTYLFNILQHGFVNALGRAVAYKPMPRQ